MGNSIVGLIGQVNQLLDCVVTFRSRLNHHVIIEPQAHLEDALRHGFPEDIYAHYLNNYLKVNELYTEEILKDIDDDFIPYLKDVIFYLREAVNVGAGTGNVSSNQIVTGQNDTTSSGTSETLASRTNQLIENAEAIQKNNKALEEALGIKQGTKMSIEEADRQNANPKHTYEYIADPQGVFYYYAGEVYMYGELPEEARNNMEKVTRCRKNPDYKREFSVNCATCAAAYALRLRGFDVKAKGNPEKRGNRNTWLSGCHSFDIWENVDGTNATPTHYADWMKKNGLAEMSPGDYKRFFEEECKEEGVYIVTVKWRGKGAHATILQRDKDGLHYIEPQVYDERKNQYHDGRDGRRSIDDLVNRMASVQPVEKGVMRVDNKLFKSEYVNLFEV